MREAKAWVRESNRSRKEKRRPENKLWEVIYEDPSRSYRQRTKGGFKGSKKAAQQWADEHRRKTRSGEWIDSTKSDTTFAELAKEWLNSQHFEKQRTGDDLRQILLLAKKPDSVAQTFGPLPVGDITYAAVRTWLRSYAASKSATTVRNSFYALRTVLDYAVDTRRISENPARQGDLRKRKALPSPKRASDAQDDRYHLTPAQVGAIIGALPEPYDTYTLLVATTGLRPGEACGLRVGDVDLEMGTLSVRGVIVRGAREDKPKNAHSRRTITMDRALTERLKEYLAAHRARALRWFTDHPDLVHPGDNLPLFVGVGVGRANGKPDVDRLDYNRPFSTRSSTAISGRRRARLHKSRTQ